MKELKYQFSKREVTYYLDAEFSYLENLVDKSNTVLILDENVAGFYKEKLEDWKTIVIPPGEAYKQQSTVDAIILQLIKIGADRKTFLVGVGGGVITDMTGYVASVYMRGVQFAFVPTTLLSMVDASIGGKNGVDVGIYKNLVGTINQPQFILFDYSLLQTLPEAEWINGCAEMIKHGCIKDAGLFQLLEENNLSSIQSNTSLFASIIERNVTIKSDVVKNDEFENGERRLLNFGHTLAHAIENSYQLPHGQAVSIGMVTAATISEEINNFNSVDKERLIKVLEQYHLTTHFSFDKAKAFETLVMDKKRAGNAMNYVLLKRIGEAEVKSIPLVQLKDLVLQII
ncbi:MAG: 3-dehydroquinate synthase [Sphingobacteriales bacterium]|nr:3-dehydroquinate synthase [Sphingobacteriales bacterium]MBI3719517.1 3-dehydroquinate synthase [Sphingobacteriales bacterium]